MLNNFQIDLFESLMGPSQQVSLYIRADLEVMAMNKYFTNPRPPELEPHHQMQFCIILQKLNYGRIKTDIYNKHNWHGI